MSDGKVPSTFGEKLVFGIPAIIVSLVLAVGLAFAIVSYFDQETRKHVASVKAELELKTTALTEELASEKTKTVALQEQVKSLDAKAAKLAEVTVALDTGLKAVGSGIEKVAGELTTYKSGQGKLDEIQNKDIAKTDTKVDDLGKRVHYIEDKIKKIDDLAKDVAGLKVDTDDLRGQSKALRTDLEGAKKRQDVTEAELTDLGDRTRQFQLRVLAARAREAADAARQVDLKNLLRVLDDVEGGK
jgi:chromosome segregation ATPase